VTERTRAVRSVTASTFGNVTWAAAAAPSSCAPSWSRVAAKHGMAAHSVTATLKFLQERDETFRDRLVGGIVLGPEPLPDC